MGRYVHVEVEVDLGDFDTEDLENELARRNRIRGLAVTIDDDDDAPVEQGGPLSHWPNRRLWDSVYLSASVKGASEELRELIYRATGRIV